MTTALMVNSRPALATSTHGMLGTDFARPTLEATTIGATVTTQVGFLPVMYALSVGNAWQQQTPGHQWWSHQVQTSHPAIPALRGRIGRQTQSCQGNTGCPQHQSHQVRLVHLLSRIALATSTHGMLGTDFARRTLEATTIGATVTTQVGFLLVMFVLSVGNAWQQQTPGHQWWSHQVQTSHPAIPALRGRRQTQS